MKHAPFPNFIETLLGLLIGVWLLIFGAYELLHAIPVGVEAPLGTMAQHLLSQCDVNVCTTTACLLFMIVGTLLTVSSAGVAHLAKRMQDGTRITTLPWWQQLQFYSLRAMLLTLCFILLADMPPLSALATAGASLVAYSFILGRIVPTKPQL